ncbi:MAG: hypothetical protein HN348_07500 [Proteobacteria bacterium]|nr:hypothetical protein [Pseudomonadota bacterium]
MNIYLVPYTWVRHIVVSLVTGAAALLTWWAVLNALVILAPVGHGMGIFWWQSLDGALYITSIATVIAFVSVLAEGSLRRRAMLWRMIYAVVAAVVTFFGTIAMYGAIAGLTQFVSVDAAVRSEILSDSSLVTLRYRLPIWLSAGFMTGFGPFFARRGQALLERFGYGLDKVEGLDEFVTDTPPTKMPTWGDFFKELFFHLAGGMLGATFGAAIWHTIGFYDWAPGDLYIAPAFAALVWGLFHGWFVWPIPEALYVGWVRILSADRYGLRIPIDRPGGGPCERFVGHFPRGLDLFLPAEQGVAELHVSFVSDGDGHYAVRGLSQQSTIVKRFLEKIDLRYDPRRPAPLETKLNMEDRVILTDGNQETLVEFLMLPKEEQ